MFSLPHWPASSVLIGQVCLLPWRHRGSYCGPMGVSLRPLRGEKGGRWFSIRSSPPLLLCPCGSLTGLIIQRTCRADWQLNESTSAGLLQAPFHGFSLCMTPPNMPPPLYKPLTMFFSTLPSSLLLHTVPPCPITVLSLLCCFEMGRNSFSYNEWNSQGQEKDIS